MNGISNAFAHDLAYVPSHKRKHRGADETVSKAPSVQPTHRSAAVSSPYTASHRSVRNLQTPVSSRTSVDIFRTFKHEEDVHQDESVEDEVERLKVGIEFEERELSILHKRRHLELFQRR
jgi:hypothetical protein